jgi:DNA-binding GntR family transcriptional regulator
MPTSGESTAYDGLRAAILSFDLLPGERISERGLEEALGASRTPIRAALMRLENEGLVQRSERAWRIAPIDLAEIRAVMEYREAMEAATARLAVARAGDDEIAALAALVTAHRQGDDEETGLRDGSDFHVALARLSRNPFLVEALAGVMTRLWRTRWLEVRSEATRAHARDEHLAIVEALAARDADAVVRLVTEHIRGTGDRLLDVLADERRRLRARGLSIIDSTTTSAPPAVVR